MKRVSILFLFFTLSLPLFSQWQPTNGPEGGTVYALEKIGNTIWAGTYGGLYYSNDDALTWNLSNIIDVESPVLAIDYSGNELFLVSAKVDSLLDRVEYFFHKSIDSGATWSILKFPRTTWSYETVRISKTNSALYVEIDNYPYYSLDGGLTWTEIDLPIYAYGIGYGDNHLFITGSYVTFSSPDFGNTWNFVDSIGSQNGIFLEDSLLIINTIYDTLQISTDLGQTWTGVPEPTSFYNGSLKRGDSGNIYILGAYRVYFSGDNGFTWDTIPPTTISSSISDIVEIGDDVVFASPEGVFISENGTNALQPTHSGLVASAINKIFASPNNELFVSSSAGSFRSPNGGLNWFKLNLAYNWDYIYDMEFVGDTIYLATGNNFYISTGGDFIPMFPSNSYVGTFAITSHQGKVYRTGNNAIAFTSDGGMTWDSLNLPNVSFQTWDDIIFLNENILIINSQGEGYISTDDAVTWTQVLDVWAPGAGHVAHFQKIGQNIYLPDNNDFWVSTDNGFTWESIEPTGLPVIDNWGWFETQLPYSLTGIGNLLFATISFHGVYTSSDNGLTWTAMNDGLTNLRGRSITSENGFLYLGTSTQGVWQHGGQFESVSGHIYEDVNNNGQQDTNEPLMSDILVQTNPFPSISTSNINGDYVLYALTLNDTLKAVPPSPYAHVNPPHYIISGTSIDKDFGIHFIPNIDDLCITATSLEPFRPGFDNTLYITVKNIGTTIQDAMVELILPSELSFSNVVPAASSVNGNILTWNIGMMDPFECVDILIDVTLSPATAIGEILCITASVSPNEPDENPINNEYILKETVVGSYDPNDKMVEPSDRLTPTQLADSLPLIYTIRFQNTGNYYAENVRITDTLSSKLDLSSLQVLSFSHPCTWYLRNGLLEFVFEDIFLPDSVNNEPASHGFVKFSIRPNQQLNLGDLLENEADIFFDFNEPIRTNTASLVFEEYTSNKNSNNSMHGTLSPNPNKGIFDIIWETPLESNGQVQVFDTSGKLIHSNSVRTGQTAIEVYLPNTPAGSYFVQIVTKNKKWGAKIIVNQE